MLVVIKGAGDLASGIALRLFHAGFDLAMTEIAVPLSVRTSVSFSRAVYEGRALVEDVTAVLVKDEAGMRDALYPLDLVKRQIAVFVDPLADIVKKLRPAVLVDAIMAKKNTGTAITDAPVVIAVGPGFSAGLDCHAVIETCRGHRLGRVITEGPAQRNTGVPGDIGGYTTERLLRSPADGIFTAVKAIGDSVKKGDDVAFLRSGLSGDGEKIPVIPEIDGILRGILPSGTPVRKGMKAGDVDPRCEVSHCFTVSDKALAIGGGVLEALLRFSALPALKF